MYALAIRYRYRGARYSKVLLAGCLVLAALGLVIGIIVSFLINWRTAPPECDREETKNRLQPYSLATLTFCLVVPPLAVLFAALPPRKKRPQTWWLWSLILVSISLGGLLVQNELGIRFAVGIDARFGEEAGEWGIGHIMSMILVSGQISELLSYSLERPTGGLSRLQILQRSFPWVRGNKAKKQSNENFSLIQTHLLSETGCRFYRLAL